MLKFCLKKWEQNKELLKQKLLDMPQYDELVHADLVKLVVKYILNENVDETDTRYDADEITEIDNGGYQGSLLYIIHEETYQPSPWEYIITYVSYGSCSGCDTLMRIKDILSKDEQVDRLMDLCRDLVTEIVAPYCHRDHWAYRERFETVAVVWEEPEWYVD